MEQSPGPYQPTPSPGTYLQGIGQSPMTPLGFPQTPGSSTALDYLHSTEWQTTGIEVSIRDTHPEPGLRRQHGIIRNVVVGSCAVYLLKEERVVNIQTDHLQLVIPKVGDRVKVISGDNRELAGVMRSIDGLEGVVEMDHGDGDVRLLALTSLAKMTLG